MLVDWLEAFGTLGAFSVALIVFGRQARDQRRAQSRLIAAWLEKPAMNSVTGGLTGSTNDDVVLVISNGSTEPVVDLLVSIKKDIPAESLYFRVFPPGRHSQGASTDFINELSLASDSSLELAFTDANDMNWLRLNGSSRLMPRRRWRREHKKIDRLILEFRQSREPLAK